MNPKYDIYEEIDRYLNEELSEAELVQFNQKLSTDAEFKSIVDAQKLANELIIDQEMIKLKARMTKEMNADNTGSGPWGKLLILSAVVVSSAALYTYITYSSSEAENAKEISVAAPTQNQPTEVKQHQASTSSIAPIVSNKNNNAAKDKQAESSSTTVPNEITPVEQTREIVVAKEMSEPIPTPHKEELKQSASVVEQLAKVNCATVHITAQVHVDYGFDNDGEATIIIDQLSVKGGKGPYSYSIDKSEFDHDTRFSGVKDGTYHVRIKDGNNCVSEVKKEVIVKTPVKEIDEAFAPAHGERWKFPLKGHADATVTIFNKAGAIVYSAAISGGSPEEWDGRSNTGVELESGNYYFAIQYSAREVVKGHISIVK